MKRRFSPFALSIAAVLFAGAAHAQDPDAPSGPPSAERIRSAAAEYDAGRRAFMDKKFEEAAVHFENAFHDAPRAEALRNAIRARMDAKQPARAATLAALGERLYSDDTTTMVVVHDTLGSTENRLQRITLACTPKCGVATDGRVVSLDDVSKFVFFVEPGAHDVVVSWEGDKTKEQKIVGVAGGRVEWNLQAPADAPPPPPIVVAKPIEDHPDQPPPHTKPFGPVIFFIGAGLTVAAGAATIVSGIDTQNSPGADAVRTQCAGQGESCQAYQDGRSKQLRTNVLLGTTIGLGVVTGVIGVFFTQWSHPKPVEKASIEPYFGGDGHGGTAGLRGSF